MRYSHYFLLMASVMIAPKLPNNTAVILAGIYLILGLWAMLIETKPRK